MINRKQLRDLIERTLSKYNLNSESGINLVFGTIQVESRGGTYLRQMSKNFDINKHAIGICQMEKATFERLKTKYWFKIELRPDKEISFPQLEYDLELSILFCRLRYLADSQPLPDADNVTKLGEYWKRVYNTVHGSGEVTQFIKHYSNK